MDTPIYWIHPFDEYTQLIDTPNRWIHLSDDDRKYNKIELAHGRVLVEIRKNVPSAKLYHNRL